jgi:hypothetical protein
MIYIAVGSQQEYPFESEVGSENFFERGISRGRNNGDLTLLHIRDKQESNNSTNEVKVWLKESRSPPQFR